MRCSDLFEMVLGYWPEEVDLDDSTEDKLHAIYCDNDQKLDHNKDHWLDIGFWAFHQALGVYLKEIGANQMTTLKPSDVPLSIFNRQMLFNLQEKCWEKERKEYVHP